jgi:hypothetical protein
LFAECGKFEYTQSAPGHDPETLEFSHPNVKEIDLLPDTSLILQHIAQVVIVHAT